MEVNIIKVTLYINNIGGLNRGILAVKNGMGGSELRRNYVRICVFWVGVLHVFISRTFFFVQILTFYNMLKINTLLTNCCDVINN